jgi:hypothetical protein
MDSLGIQKVSFVILKGGLFFRYKESHHRLKWKGEELILPFSNQLSSVFSSKLGYRSVVEEVLELSDLEFYLDLQPLTDIDWSNTISVFDTCKLLFASNE